MEGGHIPRHLLTVFSRFLEKQLFGKGSLTTNICFLFYIWSTIFSCDLHESIPCGGWLKALFLTPAETQNTKVCSSPWTRSQPLSPPSPMLVAPPPPSLTTGRGISRGYPAPSQNPGPPHIPRSEPDVLKLFFLLDLILKLKKYKI